MEIVLFIVIIILFVIIKSSISDIKENNFRLTGKINQLAKEIFELKEKLDNNSFISSTIVEQPIAPNPQPAKIVEEIKIEQKEEIFTRKVEEPKQYIPNVAAIQQHYQQKQQQNIQPQSQESWFSNWLKNNPDIEKFIGENLINKIGIAILVLGIAFFVKYAIDKDWIKEGGRVAIGIFCGAVLIAVGHKLKNNYRSFSSVLVGGGIAIFYFTISLAFHEYHLMSKPTAFVETIVVTAFAILLSIYYNRMELAIIATVGGFIAPFLLTDGNGNYVSLFTYLIILNVGIIALAYFKQWRVLQIIAFGFTTIIYNAWLFNAINTAKYNAGAALGFAIVFYILFITMSLLHHVKQKHKLLSLDFSIYLLINLAFFSAGIYILDSANHHLKGLFAACLAVFNLLLSIVLYKQNMVDKKFVLLLIGLTVSFASLIAPLQLDGNYITLFWFAEFVLLFWFYQKSNINIFKLFALIVTLLAGISLMADWVNIYNKEDIVFKIIFNKGFTTTVFATISAYIMQMLLSKEANTFYISNIKTKLVHLFYAIAMWATILVGGLLEICHQFEHYYAHTNINIIYELLYVTSLILVLYYTVKNKIKDALVFIIFGVVCLLFVLYIACASSIYTALQIMLTYNKNEIFVIGYVAFFAALMYLYYLLLKMLNHIFKQDKGIATTFYGLTIVQMLIMISIFLYHIYVFASVKNGVKIFTAENNFERAGLSIVWGVISFATMIFGMQKRIKPLRIIALSLFGITLMKLFLYDIRNMNEGGKIAAFILLGVLLLIISFMYNKLKKLLIDDAIENS